MNVESPLNTLHLGRSPEYWEDYNARAGQAKVPTYYEPAKIISMSEVRHQLWLILKTVRQLRRQLLNFRKLVRTSKVVRKPDIRREMSFWEMPLSRRPWTKSLFCWQIKERGLALTIRVAD